MLEQITEKVFDLQAIAVFSMEPEVECQMPSFRGNCKRPKGRALIALIGVVMHRWCPFRSPRPLQIRNEQNAAFLEEDQRGAKFLGFFYPRPLVAVPVLYLLFSPLSGPALRFLAAPCQGP